MTQFQLTTPSLGTIQHFLECDIKDCKRHCQFYCNPCRQQMCKQCRDGHLKIPQYKNHEVVLSQQRNWSLPVEKCRMHLTKDIDMLCEECQLPLCSKCATKENHRGHNFIDLETVYEENMALYFGEVSKIIEEFLPTSQKLHEEIKDDATQIKKTMDNLRTEMKADGESLKSMVDTVVSENIQQVDNIEQSLLEKVNSLDTTFQDYISYLIDLVKEFHGRLSSSKLTNLTPKLSEKIQDIQPIPERTKSVTPFFIIGQYCESDVAKLLGKVNGQETNAEALLERPGSVTPLCAAEQYLQNDCPELLEHINVHETKTHAEITKPVTPAVTSDQCRGTNGLELLGKMDVQKTESETRKIKPNERQEEPISEKKKEERQKNSAMKQSMHRSYVFTKMRTFIVPVDGPACHISLDTFGILWISDHKGNIVQTNLQGNQLQKIKTSGRSGCHTIAKNGNLIFTNEKTRVINAKLENNITKLIKTGDWVPISIHSSHINEDILVGMVRGGEAKVTRYNKSGKELQNIFLESEEQRLYDCPWYITENSNGDVCVSDIEKQAVVVVNKTGQYRFSYTGQTTGFLPYGICTDVLHHILVCDNNSNTIDLLDREGQFLSLLLTQQQGVYGPRSVCVDGDKLYVGQFNTVAVFKHSQ